MTSNTNHNAKIGGIAASLASVLLFGVILIAVNFIAGFAVLRADLTAEKLFTLCGRNV